MGARPDDQIEHEVTGEDPVSVYIVEDHDIVRDRLVDLVAGSPGLVVVGSSGSPEVALDEIGRLNPRVAVVDGRLAEVSGLDVCRILRETAPAVSCVILTSAVALAWGRAEAARAGAAAYLVKRLADFPLIEIIRQVADGHRPIADPVPPGSADH